MTPQTSAATKADELVIRLATRADALACNEFHNAYYGSSRTLTQWLWEFAWGIASENEQLPFALALQGDRVVGTQALIPIPFIDSDGRFMTAKSEETLVAREMRGRNLAARMYEILFRVAAERGFQAIWGFTTAEKAFRSMGFDIPLRTAQMIRPFRRDAALQFLGEQQHSKSRRIGLAAISLAATQWSNARSVLANLTNRASNSLSLLILDEAPAWADDLAKRFIQRWGGATIYRGREYMAWRLFNNPYARAVTIAAIASGTPVGYSSFVMGEGGVVYLVDIIVADKDRSKNLELQSVHLLLREVERRAFDLGALAIRSWTITDHPFEKIVRQCAIQRGWFSVRRGGAMVNATGYLSNPRSSATHPDTWYITRIFTEGVLG